MRLKSKYFDKTLEYSQIFVYNKRVDFLLLSILLRQEFFMQEQNMQEQIAQESNAQAPLQESAQVPKKKRYLVLEKL